MSAALYSTKDDLDFDSTLADDEEADSSDDGQAVFLGLHRPQEAEFVAKLSTSLPSSSFAPKLKEQRSREFLRRKTLLLSTGKRNQSTACLSEQDAARLHQYPTSDDSDSCVTPVKTFRSSTPTRIQQDPSDLTFDFGALHVSTPRGSDSDSLDEAGSDKENVPIPTPSASRHICRVTSFEEGEVELNRHPLLDLQDIDDELPQLDMGGLRLSDFADQGTGLENGGMEEFGAYETRGQEQPGDHVFSQFVGESIPSPATPGQLDASLCNDSPLEVARGGVVAIPSRSHHLASIRADVGSPYRNLPPSPLHHAAPDDGSVTAVHLASLESPPASEKSLPAITPSHRTAMPSADLVQRGKKLLKSSAIAKPSLPDLESQKSSQLRTTIKGQLDSALSVNVKKTLGQSRSAASAPSAAARSMVSPPAKILASRSHDTAATGSSDQIQAKPRVRPDPRPAIKHVPKPALPLSSSISHVIPRPALAKKTSLPRPKAGSLKNPMMPPPPTLIPTKRPATTSTQLSRYPLFSQPHPLQIQPRASPKSRPALGQPARSYNAVPLLAAPLFSVGVGQSPVANGRIGHRSPAKQSLHKKQSVEGTPRKLGTPMKFGTPRQAYSTGQGSMLMTTSAYCSTTLPATFVAPAVSRIPPPMVSSMSTTFSSTQSVDAELATMPKEDVVSDIPESVSDGPPASSTRQATEGVPSSSASPPSSSSYTSVSTQASKDETDEPAESTAPSSPSSPRRTSRPRRLASASAKSPKTKAKPSTPKTTSAAPVASGLPGLTEKHIKTATARNTAKNQVYHCAIDRKIIRNPGPRPPSPTSKIRTSEEKNEEEKKKGRGDRAKRRMGSAVEDVRPLIERLEVRKAPGDDSDYEYQSPERPVKRAKIEGGRKMLRWDKEVLVIRHDELKPAEQSREKVKETGKSCFRFKSQAPLDDHGNVLNSSKPIDDLKRQRVVVTAVFYQGEEPVPAPSSATRSKKK